MWEHRSVLGILIGITLCVSLWRISYQESKIITEYSPYIDVVNGNERTTIAYRSPVSLNELPRYDFTTLIDLDNFSFLMNQKACGQNSEYPFTLVLIHSAPRNWIKRNTIRETWGREDIRARVLFMLGAANSKDLQLKLEEENNLFHDMVQGNFIDAYRNMTYKHVMALKWFTYYCPKVKYLLKTDDDVFVNTPTVYKFLDSPADRKNFLICYKVESARIRRSYRSKWRVSTKEYPGRYYPTYCLGYSIIYSSDTAFTLYKVAQKSPYFWIDDVHITGSLTEASNITISSIGNLYLGKSQRESIFKNKLNATSTLFLFTSPNLTEKEIRSLWQSVTPAES